MRRLILYFLHVSVALSIHILYRYYVLPVSSDSSHPPTFFVGAVAQISADRPLHHFHSTLSFDQLTVDRTKEETVLYA